MRSCILEIWSCYMAAQGELQKWGRADTGDYTTGNSFRLTNFSSGGSLQDIKSSWDTATWTDFE